MNRRFSCECVSKPQPDPTVISTGNGYTCKSLIIDRNYPKYRSVSSDESKVVYRKKMCCSNCGKPGHEFRQCIEPTTSFGLINIRIADDGDNEDSILLKDQFSTNKGTHYKVTSKKYPEVKCYITDNIKLYEDNRNHYKIEVEGIPFENEEQIRKFSYYRNKIRFLMVSRKFSLGFVEFIRGKYDPHDAKAIIKLFEQMTTEEIDIISKNNYDNILYKFLGKSNEDINNVVQRIYQGKYSGEYLEAKLKFEILLTGCGDTAIPFNLYFYTKQIRPKWILREWGFPKGRRDNRGEENLACACREFEEETGYHKNDYCVLNKIEPVEERLIGTNGITYKHVYYLAVDESSHQEMPLNIDYQEIGEVRWLTYDEAMQYIRPYHADKKKILTKVYLFLLNYLIDSDVNNYNN